MPSGLVGTNYTESNSNVMETPYFEKLADFSRVMWICGGFAPCDPSALLATKKASFEKKDMTFGNPSYHGTKKCGISENIDFDFFSFIGQKVVFWVNKTVFWGVLDRA